MILDAKNPKWANKEHNVIEIEVLLDENEGFVPYIASPDDCVATGLSLYNMAMRGRFGDIADSDEERILRGEMEPPEGYKVIDGEIVNVAEQERLAKEDYRRQLAALQTPEATAKAELDAKYAADRKAQMHELLAKLES